MTPADNGHVEVKLLLAGTPAVAHYFGIWLRPEDQRAELLKAADFLTKVANSLEAPSNDTPKLV